MEDDVYNLLRLLGNRTRVGILELLSEEPRFLSDIARDLEIGQQAILRHLREMEDLNVIEEDLTVIEDVEARKGRKRKYYRIAEKKSHRLIIDIRPDNFNIHSVPSDLRPLSESKEEYCKNVNDIISEFEDFKTEVDHMEKIERYEKILDFEERIKNEIYSLRNARSHCERILHELARLKSKFL